MSIHREASLNRVTVLGAGQSGLQIALQCAAYGVSVRLFDAQASQLDSAKSRAKRTLREMVREGIIGRFDMQACLERVSFQMDPVAAGRDCDLLLETVTEDLNVKRDVLRRFHSICPAHTVFTTNTSFLLPSSLAHASGRPDRLAGFHFHSPVWKANVVDVMPHRLTSESTVERLLEFGRRIGQNPIRLHKETNGYVYNRLSLPMLLQAMQLAASGVASVEDIDRAWMAVTKMPLGPFGMLDNIGLDTVCRIAEYWGKVLGDKSVTRSVEYLGERVAGGKLGTKTNEGMYQYPSPSYLDDSFLIAADRRAQRRPQHHRRFLMKLVPAELHPRVHRKFASCGAAIVFGDGATSQLLAERLEQAGCVVHRLASGGADEIAASFGGAAARGPVNHLFCFAGSLDCLRDRRLFDTEMIGMFELVKRWYQHLVSLDRLDTATFTGVTRLGGDFGVKRPPQHPMGGAINGLAKALFMEGAAANSLGPRTTAVDLAPDKDPAASVETILLETAISQARVVTGTRDEMVERHAATEVGYAEGRRHSIRLFADEVEFFSVPRIKQGEWIFTGGARGITSEVARAMGMQYGVRLHLVGRSSLPATDFTQLSKQELGHLKRRVMTEAYRHGRKPNYAWDDIARGMESQKNIQRMRQDGIDVTYHACDVCERAAVELLLRDVRKHGPVRGIVHGAGVEVTSRIEKKDETTVRATIGPKALGTLALMEASRDDPLDFFVCFGSLAGRFGGIGQADYALANELQAKLISWYRGQRPECKSVLFHWPGWADVGMAARSASRRSLVNRGHRFLNRADGVRFFLHELASGVQHAEVAIMDEAELPAVWQCHE